MNSAFRDANARQWIKEINMSTRKSRNRFRIFRALVICIIVVLAIGAAGYAVGTRLFDHHGIVYINSGYSDSEREPMENVLDKSEDEDTEDADVAAVLKDMTLHEKVSQMFVTSPEALTGIKTAVQAGTTTQTNLEQYPPGGLAYAEKNFENEEQTKTMLENTQQYALQRSGIRLLIVTPADGGAIKIGEDNQNASIPISYFPVDSSEDAGITSMTEQEISEKYLDSLKSQLGSRTKIAVARNLIINDVDSRAVSVSRDWIRDILREDLGYSGVVMTEDLSLLAASDGSTVSELAISAIRAGADLIYTGTDAKAAIQAVEAAVKDGSITEEMIDQSVTRILSLKNEYEMISLTEKTYEGSGELDASEQAADTASNQAAADNANNKKNNGGNNSGTNLPEGVVDDNAAGGKNSNTGSAGVEGLVDDPVQSGNAAG